MKMFNRCPSCKKLVFGYKKSRNKSFLKKERRYKYFCPYCNIELIIEIKNKTMFWALITLTSIGWLFLLKGIKNYFFEMIMINEEWGATLLRAQALAYLLSAAAYAATVFFIGNKTVKVRARRDEPELP